MILWGSGYTWGTSNVPLAQDIISYLNQLMYNTPSRFQNTNQDIQQLNSVISMIETDVGGISKLPSFGILTNGGRLVNERWNHRLSNAGTSYVNNVNGQYLNGLMNQITVSAETITNNLNNGNYGLKDVNTNEDGSIDSEQLTSDTENFVSKIIEYMHSLIGKYVEFLKPLIITNSGGANWGSGLGR